jgi:hypothetical protein
MTMRLYLCSYRPSTSEPPKRITEWHSRSPSRLLKAVTYWGTLVAIGWSLHGTTRHQKLLPPVTACTITARSSPSPDGSHLTSRNRPSHQATTFSLHEEVPTHPAREETSPRRAATVPLGAATCRCPWDGKPGARPPKRLETLNTRRSLSRYRKRFCTI